MSIKFLNWQLLFSNVITSCRNQQPIKSEQMTSWSLRLLLTLPSKITHLHRWQNDERIWGKFCPESVPSVIWISIRNICSSKNLKYTLGKGEGILILSALKEHFSKVIYLRNALFYTINGHWRDLQFVLGFFLFMQTFMCSGYNSVWVSPSWSNWGTTVGD